MGKSVQLLDSLLASGLSGKKIIDIPEEIPPKIPPRMKKKGPDLPEKPPHMRPKKPDDDTLSSSQNALVVKASTKHQHSGIWLTNSDRYNTQRAVANEREVLVAASRAGRERPIEKRQREPAKLLAPTSGSLTEYITAKKNVINITNKSSSNKKTDHHTSLAVVSATRNQQQPMVLIPRGFLVDSRGAVINPHLWGSAPVVSYALWMQQRDQQQRFHKPGHHQETKLTPILASSTSVKTRSNSVTRSGSLTSQGSSSSDSGNETFPKSVLKKHKRNSGGSLNPKTSHKVEHKKNVTFNAFATVQLMEE